MDNTAFGFVGLLMLAVIVPIALAVLVMVPVVVIAVLTWANHLLTRAVGIGIDAARAQHRQKRDARRAELTTPQPTEGAI